MKRVRSDVQSVSERAEFLHIRAKHQISELGERQEDYKEHDVECDEVFGSVVDGNLNDTHRLVEIEVFEQLYIHYTLSLIHI